MTSNIPFNITTSRQLVRGNRDGQNRDWLFVQEHDGRLWCTNTHWLAPADYFDRVRGDQDWKVGTWDASTGQHLNTNAPDISSLFPDIAGTVELEPFMVEGVGRVIAQRGDVDLYVYTWGEGRTSFNRRYLDIWLAQDGRHDQRWRLMSAGTLKPALVQRSSSYTRATGGNVETWQTVGLIMPVRIS